MDEFKKYVDNMLWPILVETVHKMIMYPHHKAYIIDTMLKENPDLNSNMVADTLNISYGEALVILYECLNKK